VLQRDRVLERLRAVGDVREGAVVEHRAVLEDLDERGARVLGGGAQDAGRCCLSRSTVRATNVALGPSASDTGLNGSSIDPNGVDFVTFPRSRRRRDLTLREPVDLVVEEQDLDRHVAPQRVDQVVAADRQRVAVAGHDPDREVVARAASPVASAGAAAVDAVHPVGVHVVREAPGAADAGDEHDPLGRDAQLGHELLDGRQHRVVPTTRTPPRLLI
jgi:hypothetical protein